MAESPATVRSRPPATWVHRCLFVAWVGGILPVLSTCWLGREALQSAWLPLHMTLVVATGSVGWALLEQGERAGGWLGLLGGFGVSAVTGIAGPRLEGRWLGEASAFVLPLGLWALLGGAAVGLLVKTRMPRSRLVRDGET